MKSLLLISLLLVFSVIVANADQTNNEKAILLSQCVADQRIIMLFHPDPMVSGTADGIAQDYFKCAMVLHSGPEEELKEAYSERAASLEMIYNGRGEKAVLQEAQKNTEVCAEIAWAVLKTLE